MIAPIPYKNQEIRFKITDPGDHLQSYWLAGYFYENGMLYFIENYRKRELAGRQPVIIDVGACIGNHTIFFAKVMGAYVYAFEPVKANMELLKANALLNGVFHQILPILKGAGSARSQVKFQPDTTGNSGMGKISPEGFDTIDLVPIDQVISPSHEVDVMKIDVEGYNIPVLEGARRTIEHDHPEIYIECQTPAELQEVENFLLPLGYTRYPHPFNATPTYLFYY